MSESPAAPIGPGRGISWSWSFFLLGVLYAVPAIAVTPFQPSAGLALAVGVLPAAIFNLPGFRRARRTIPVIGVLCGLSFVVGALLTQIPVLAVVGILVLAVAASLWARRGRAGALVLVLGLPLVGIGLSFADLHTAVLFAGLIVVGSLYAWAIAMAWPERQVPAPPRPPIPGVAQAVTYGVLLGLAGAIAAAIGYLLHLEHVGWATGAALLVMRPVRDQLVRRSIGRAVSVLVGAFAAAAFAVIEPSPWATSLVAGLVLACLTATQGSRWYIAPAFSSFLVLTLLLQQSSESPVERFNERVLETFLGVGLALLFGAVVPAVIGAVRRARERGTTPPAA